MGVGKFAVERRPSFGSVLDKFCIGNIVERIVGMAKLRALLWSRCGLRQLTGFFYLTIGNQRVEKLNGKRTLRFWGP